MRLIGKAKLEKVKHKNKGNTKLANAIGSLIADIEANNWQNEQQLKETRKDADCVHNDGFFFFNLSVHRTMVLVEFDEQEATVVWVGNHAAYDATFKNNKRTIKAWLKRNDWIV
jgi:mRNA-degrading endonuclease HigB of HigAB toxin-antitoxin module